MYSLEVFSSVVWGSIIRCRESQSYVSYPSEVDDGFFSEMGYHLCNSLVPSYPPEVITNLLSWLHGWNFTIDLYRILEHAVDECHHRRPKNIGPFSLEDILGREISNQDVVLNKVMAMHDALPPRFKEAKLSPDGGNVGLEDKFSFQAANITATLQLVRMFLFTMEDATIEKKSPLQRIC